MNSENRRLKIIDILNQQDKPLSGTALADILEVSRQVIVQDIAILRAENKNIISTNRGYMLFRPDQNSYREYLTVNHSQNHILDEFFTIVDNGGTILNTAVNHDLYGRIEADLYIANRMDAKSFVDKMIRSKDRPLSFLTSGDHYHLIETKNIETMNFIKAELKKLDYISDEEKEPEN